MYHRCPYYQGRRKRESTDEEDRGARCDAYFQQLEALAEQQQMEQEQMEQEQMHAGQELQHQRQEQEHFKEDQEHEELAVQLERKGRSEFGIWGSRGSAQRHG